MQPQRLLPLYCQTVTPSIHTSAIANSVNLVLVKVATLIVQEVKLLPQRQKNTINTISFPFYPSVACLPGSLLLRGYQDTNLSLTHSICSKLNREAAFATFTEIQSVTPGSAAATQYQRPSLSTASPQQALGPCHPQQIFRLCIFHQHRLSHQASDRQAGTFLSILPISLLMTKMDHSKDT